jgi:O-antigen/teichoic acid export membrane protein
VTEAAEPAAPPPVHEPITPRLLRKNLSVVSLTYLVSGLAGVAAQAVLARRLGNAIFGDYVAAFSLVAIVTVLDRLARDEYVVREGVRDHRRLEGLVADVLGLKLVTGTLVVALTVALSAILGFPRAAAEAALLLAVMAGASAVAEPFRSGLQAIERLEVAAAISIVNAIVSATGVVVLVEAGQGLVTAIAFSTLVTIAMIPVSWMALRRRLRIRVRVSPRRMLRLARESFAFTVAGVLTVATGYVDALVIQGMLGRDATGLYGAAYRIIVVLGWIPLVFQTSMYRSISYLAHRSREEFGPFVERWAAVMCLVALPIAAGGQVVGGRLVVLVFGSHFGPAVPAFKILLLSLPLAFPAVLLGTAVVVDERPQAAAWIFAGAFTGNLAANLALVPSLGIQASAWITVATEAFIAGASTVVLSHRGVHTAWYVLPLRGVAVAAVMALAIVPLRTQPLAVPVAVGTLVYAMGLAAAGVPRRLGADRRVPSFSWSRAR